MANNPGAKKRIRQNETRRVRNRYKLIGMRMQIKALRNTTDKEEATKLLPELYSTIDRVAKAKIIHDNKAANLKRQIATYVNSL